MKILITGVCGFLGRWIAEGLLESFEGVQIVGVDNLSRSGSQNNCQDLRDLGVDFHHGDLRLMSDLESLPAVDWVIDCAALASVLAGASGPHSPRQLLEHNLIGSLNLLEYCRLHGSGLILISTSRVYSIAELSTLPLIDNGQAFELKATGELPTGVSKAGISESFSNAAPVSIYGATKLSSETMAREYASTFGFPLRINRCGVLAGAGQFGRPDQGIFSFWIHSHLRRSPLRYIGFDGSGHQVRDCLHPWDVAQLVVSQIRCGDDVTKPVIANVSGGLESARSLHQVSTWCDKKFGPHSIESSLEVRPYDLPWIVLDSSLAREAWQWQPLRTTDKIFEEIASHATENPDWLDRT